MTHLSNTMMSSKDNQQTEEIVIEKNIVIDASPEVVFKAITEQEELTNWFPDQAVFEAKLGGKMKFLNHKIGTREEWLAARLALLKAEKELTQRSDELAEWRQKLPWVRIDKEYRFETDEGTASLADLFRGRSQLLVYHFMFGPEYTGGCPACSAVADGFNGFAVHLEHHDVAMIAVSRAPIAALQAYKRQMGWTFTWASSLDSDFNYDFNASFTGEQQREGGNEYNYRTIGALSDSA